MILLRLRVDGFGALAGEWTFDPTRVNLVVGENEKGKTTLAAAITAALYGLDSDRRQYRDRATPLDHYRPWSGKAYALELEFEHGGNRYLVNRNFASGKVSVFMNGHDKTEEYRHGSGEYKVGEELLGLSVDQFARTALWLQPGPTKFGGDDVQPDVTIVSELERLASSTTGDASTASAIRTLDDALRNYAGMQQSGMVANEIKKLNVALSANQSDLTAAEQDRGALAEHLARLAELENEEKSLASKLETARRAGARERTTELASLLERDTNDRKQIAEWRAERTKLEPARQFPADAAQRLRTAQAERDAARRTLETAKENRARDLEAPRSAVAEALKKNADFAWAEPRHIEELRVLERDLETVHAQAKTAQEKQNELARDLETRGVSLDLVVERERRFGALTGDDRSMLTQYPAQTQAIVVDSENAQKAIAGGQALIEGVARSRRNHRMLAIVSLVVALLAGAGSVYLAINGWSLGSFAGLGLTLVAVAAAILLFLRSMSYRNAERAEALRQVLDAQRRLGEMRARRKEREDVLVRLAERLGFTDVTALLREHGEYLRLTNESQRMSWITEDRNRAGQQEEAAIANVRAWAARAKFAADIEPLQALARLRMGIGAVLDAKAKERELALAERGLDAQETEAQARIARANEALAEVAKKLSISGAGDDALVAAVEARAADHARLLSLEKDLLPPLEARVLHDLVRGSYEQERTRLAKVLAEQGDGPAADAVAAKAAAADAAQIERELQRVHKDRLELVHQLGGRDRAAGERIAQRMVERTNLLTALERASRFKDAVELARDRLQSVARETHARWSEALSSRVDELLTRFGLGHQSFRISDELDMSLNVGAERLNQARIEQALSAGARDQVRLALRVAVCEYLARSGERLPLVLDDPISTSDEDRTDRLLRTFAEAVRAGHQVVVLTCHRAKIEAARAADPAWFLETMAITDLGGVRTGA